MLSSLDICPIEFEEFFESTDDLLTSSSQEERRMRAKEARKKQISAYHVWEESQCSSSQISTRVKSKEKKVSFHTKDRFREALSRNDRNEGRVSIADVAGSDRKVGSLIRWFGL